VVVAVPVLLPTVETVEYPTPDAVDEPDEEPAPPVVLE
jgi:hypothetical protein